MNKTTTNKTSKHPVSEADPILAYSSAQPPACQLICIQLRELIDKALPKATSQIWHGSPVWFLDENPVVGYSANAKGVHLLFWNGQAFDEPDLKPMGKYYAAQASFRDASEIKPATIRRWLRQAKANVFDSKAFFANKRQKGKSAAK